MLPPSPPSLLISDARQFGYTQGFNPSALRRKQQRPHHSKCSKYCRRLAFSLDALTVLMTVGHLAHMSVYPNLRTDFSSFVRGLADAEKFIAEVQDYLFNVNSTGTL